MQDQFEEQTIFISPCKVSLYRIPTRGPSGHSSGEWKITDKIFEGRLKIVSLGERCDIKCEDQNTGVLFAACLIPYGKRTQYVEAAMDSSRNYVIRVEDSASKQHAFLGLSFSERSESFDFNEALLRHEKHVERERASQALSGAQSNGEPQSNGEGSTGSELAVMREVQTLYNHDDYSLKEGQTMRVNIQKRAPKPGGLMSSVTPAISLGIPLVPLPTSTNSSSGAVAVPLKVPNLLDQ